MTKICTNTIFVYLRVKSDWKLTAKKIIIKKTNSQRFFFTSRRFARTIMNNNKKKKCLVIVDTILGDAAIPHEQQVHKCGTHKAYIKFKILISLTSYVFEYTSKFYYT